MDDDQRTIRERIFGMILASEEDAVLAGEMMGMEYIWVVIDSHRAQISLLSTQGMDMYALDHYEARDGESADMIEYFARCFPKAKSEIWAWIKRYGFKETWESMANGLDDGF